MGATSYRKSWQTLSSDLGMFEYFDVRVRYLGSGRWHLRQLRTWSDESDSMRIGTKKLIAWVIERDAEGEENHEPSDGQPDPQQGAQDLANRHRHRLVKRVTIKPLELQRDRSERDDDRHQPEKFFELGNLRHHPQKIPVLEPGRSLHPEVSLVTQRVTQPECESDEDTVQNLVQLKIDFLLAPQHANSQSG